MTTVPSAASVLGSATPAAVINGIGSGITTQQIVTALIRRYEQPQQYLAQEQATYKAEIVALRAVNTDAQSLLTAAQSLAKVSSWDLAAASSSNTSVATALASPGAKLGSASFTVTQLAQTNMLVSNVALAAPTQGATTEKSMILATGTAGLGFSALGAPAASLAYGTYAVKVSQASSGATLVSASPLAATTTISTPNTTLTLTVDGVAHKLTLKTGTYSPSQLVAQINTTAKAQAVPITASLTSTGNLELSTDTQGSKAAIGIKTTTYSVASTLKLKTTQSSIGASAVVTVAGHETTLTSIAPGQSVKIQAGPNAATTITFTIATTAGPGGSLVSTGTAKVAYVSTGTGTLTALASAIDSSGLEVSASTVKVSTGGYKLEVQSTKTGAANAVYVTSAVLALRSVQTARTAELKVGGTNGFTVTSSTDTFTGVMQGTAITVASVGAATVTVSADATAEATAVQSLVTAANNLLTSINSYTSYTATSRKAGALLGNPVVESLRSQVLTVLASTRGTSSLADLKTAGVSLTKTGTATFTKSKFVDAYKATPAQVRALFSQGGTFAASSPSFAGAVSFVSATTTTPRGTYAVKVNSWATEASDTGKTVGAANAVTTSETLTITMGTKTVTYTTKGATGSVSGESLTNIAAALNHEFASQGMQLDAHVTHNLTQHRLVLTSSVYGSNGDFSVRSTLAASKGGVGLVPTATTPVAFAGQNVAGTIGGVAATGAGDVLIARNGLTLTVTPTSAGNPPPAQPLGTFTYSPGAAQSLVDAAHAASDAVSGSITGQIQNITAESKTLTSQIAMYKQLATAERKALIQQFAGMNAAIGRIKNESSALQSQIAKLG